MINVRKGLAGLALAVGSLASSAWAQPTVLTTSNWLPPTHHLVKNVMEPWAKQLHEATNGRVQLRTLPTALVPPANFFDSIRNGLQDIGFSAHGYTPGRFVLPGIAEVPFLGDTSESMSIAYQRVFEQHLSKVDEHSGLVVLAVFVHGPGQMFTTGKQITSIADMRTMRWRVGGGVVADAAKLLGATSFLKAPGETYELLSSGIADGVFFPLDTMVTFRLAEVVKHATLIPGGFYNTSFALVMNKRRFDSLPEPDQAAIMKISGEHFSAMAGRSWDAGDALGLDALKKANAQLNDASPELVNSLKETLAPLEGRWIAAATEKGVDGAAALAQFRAELQKLKNR